MSLSTDEEKGIWVGGDQGSVTLVSRSMAVQRRVRVDKARLTVTTLMRDKSGCLWFGTEDGVVGQLVGNDSTVCFTENSAPVMAMVEDREGSIWIGRAGGGLHRLRKGKFTTYGMIDGLESDYVQCIYPDPHDAGRVWIGTNNGGISRFSHNMITTLPRQPWHANLNLNALFVDRGGTLWVGNVQGLQQLLGTHLESVVPEAGQEFGTVRGIAEDADGRLWLTTRRGVFVSSSAKTHFRSYGDSSSMIREPVWSVYTSKGGSEIWIATVGKGLIRLVSGGHGMRRTDYTTEDGLSSNEVRSFLEDKEGTLWFGTYHGGLVRFKSGRFHAVTTENGLFDDNVFSVLEDDDGFLWMSSNLGVFRTSKKELDDFVEGRAPGVNCTVYGTADGMRTNECNGGAQYSGVRSGDGRLWFATLAGAAVIDPARSRINDVPPPVILESCAIDRTPVRIADKVHAGPGSGDLEFTYTALSFVAPEKTRFRYRLEGFDAEWVDAGGRRVAYYTNIPPGEYTFRVLAANNDGVWNTIGASMRVSLSPHFYQTSWFYVLCVVVIGVFGSLVYHFYRTYKDREKTAARLQAQLAQAELQVLKMQLQPHFLFNTMHAISSLMHKDIEAADEMMSRLGDLLRCTLESNGTQEVELQQELETLDLYLAIEQIRLGDRLRATRDIPAELMSAVVPNLILQPLFENAIRYGVSPREEGGSVDIRITRRDNMLGVTVCDDGPGIGEQAREGVGLSNTRARLEQLYGTNQKFTYSNRAGGGFCVTLEIPLRIERNATYRSVSNKRFQSADTYR
jgi:streptogramin lyase/two-component sensor histidine kinase